MTRAVPTVVVCVLVSLAVAAHGPDALGSVVNNPPRSGATNASAALRSASVVLDSAHQSKTDICHRIEGGNGFVSITVAATSVDAHLQHGDARVGDPVPGQPGLMFGTGCMPVAPRLDQSYDPVRTCAFGFGSNVQSAQTFTVGIAGILSRVEVNIRKEWPTTSDLLFDIRPTIDGVPVASDAAALVSGIIPVALISYDFEFVSIDVSSAHIPVSPGDVLAIVLRAPGEFGSIHYFWVGDCRPTTEYESGGLFYRSVPPSLDWIEFQGHDHAFRTFVVSTD